VAVALGNEVYGGRTVVGAIPFTDSLDTTEATTDSNDSNDSNVACGAPATDASVWYEVTADRDGRHVPVGPQAAVPASCWSWRISATVRAHPRQTCKGAQADSSCVVRVRQ
jgi:hypothetical protein